MYLDNRKSRGGNNFCLSEKKENKELSRNQVTEVAPNLIARQGQPGIDVFWAFFREHIRNDNTRQAYLVAVLRFLDWCEAQGLSLKTIQARTVAGYIRDHPGSVLTVKQHLAAIRKLFAWFVDRGILQVNPAEKIEGPSHIIPTRGKTPTLTAAETRRLLDGIDLNNLIGLRDRALVAVLIFSFSRVSVVIQMCLKDYFWKEGVRYFRFQEKKGRYHEVPVHRTALVYIDAYIDAAEIAEDSDGPLFRNSDRSRSRNRLLRQPMTRASVLKMLKRRTAEAGLPSTICAHSFRGTGIREYLRSGGSLESAARIAGHQTMRSTQRYAPEPDPITPEDIDRIEI